MIRKAFVMSVYPEYVEEYKNRHNPIWQELEDLLKEHGILDYSIFHHPETNQLFGYVEMEDEERWNAVAQSEICRRWWRYMKAIMPSNPDNSPVSRELEEVFHIEK
jgi:L-rhamnose mutarotase